MNAESQGCIIMEENDHRNGERQEDSGEESNQAILPLLQAPGNQQPHQVTNFYIDNILRPDFGRRKNGTLTREENHLGVIRRENHLTRRAPKTGSLQQQGGAGVEGREEDTRPAREAKKADIVAGDVPLKPRGDSGDQCLSSDSDSSSQASSTPSSKPILWPAWVYCTRYSDRPSSGWFLEKIHNWNCYFLLEKQNKTKQKRKSQLRCFALYLKERWSDRIH